MSLGIATDTSPTDMHFDALRDALRMSGGIAQADDLARLLDDHRLNDFVSLSGLITHCKVFGFPFHSSFWVPMFQFDLRDLSLNRGVAPVVLELADVLDGWSLANWFARPHACLGLRRPVDMLATLPAMVLSAACDSHIKQRIVPARAFSIPGRG